MESRLTLHAVKTVHTLVWALFAGSIIAIPVCAALGNLKLAWGLVSFVLLEVAILLANRMRCPLTDVASRFTTDRRDNFDIYLPLWLARHNKVVFGGLYLAGVIHAAWVTFHAAS